MKMKKLFVLFSMIILAFSMTACNKGTESVEFEYDKEQLISNSQQVFDIFLGFNNEELEFYGRSDIDFYVSMVKAVQTANDQAGTFKSIDDADCKEVGSTVVVTLYAAYSDNKVEVNFTYDQSSVDSYMSSGLYVPIEVTASEIVTKGELMKEAGLNTLMGMGTVFIVLIFISIIISLFKFIPNENKNNNKKEIQPVPSSKPVVKTVSNENLMDNSELVAVITAAVHAASENNSQISKDQLVVRSIRRARR